MIYIGSGQEDSCVTTLQEGKSVIVVGERRSGLTAFASEVLRLLSSASSARGSSPRMHRCVVIDARVLGQGDQSLRELAEGCIDKLFGASVPDDIGLALGQLKREYSYQLLTSLLARVNERVGGTSLLCIDHFESLVSRLDERSWISLRMLVEDHRVQLLLLSRLTIREVERMSDSKLSETITQTIVLSPLQAPDAQIQLIRSAVPPPWPDEFERASSEIVALGGGFRWLTQVLAKIVFQSARSADPGSGSQALVDRAISERRMEVEDTLVSLVRAFSERESDERLRSELKSELRALFNVVFAPAWCVSRTDSHVDRLKRLGHIRFQGNVVRFSSPLVESFVRCQLRKLKSAGALDDSATDAWLAYDDLLRRIIRSRARTPIRELAASVEGLSEAVAQFERSRTWWGDAAGEDVLDDLAADSLHSLLVRAGAVDSAWIQQVGATLDVVSKARRTMMTTKRDVLRSEERTHVLDALSRLRAALETLAPRRVEVMASRPATRPTRRLVRWLHISDIHLKDNAAYGENVILKSFLRTLKEQESLPISHRLGPPPDLVLFTGDLAHSGTKQQYERAAPFFDELLSLVGLGRDRLFVVPGNHDVSRERTKYLARTLESDEAVHQAFRSERWRRLYGERLSDYNEFCRTFYARCPERVATTANGLIVPQNVSIGASTVSIHSVNAEWCGGLDDDRGNLVIGLALMEEELFTGIGAADLRIVLMHQSFDYLAEFERTRFLRTLSQYAHVLLRGHLHKGEITRSITPHGTLTEMAAGALFDHPDHENTAQFVEVDLETHVYTVYPVMFSRDRHGWVRDPRLGGTHPTYEPTGTMRG